MKREIFKETAFTTLRSAIAPVLLTIAVMAMIIYGLHVTERSNRAEGLRVLQEGIMRAVVKCYAVEGNYPDDISYLEENYGVRIDYEKYAVHYEIFASNVLPDITVIELTA